MKYPYLLFLKGMPLKGIDNSDIDNYVGKNIAATIVNILDVPESK